MLRRAVLLLLSVAAACGVVGPTAARAATSADYIGVNLQPLMKDPAISEDRWGSFLTSLRSGQMSVSRIDVNWSLVEKTPPVNGVHTYQWNDLTGGQRGSIDFLMASAAAYGIRAVPTFTAPPPWVPVAGNRLPDAQFANFAAFVAAFAARYGAGGHFWVEHPELPNLAVGDYEIWNEANSTNSWTGGPDAAAYARLLKVVYPVVKAAQPASRIDASIGWPDFANYLTAVWNNGAGSSFDGIAFHPYAPYAPEILRLTEALRATLGALGRGNMPILITETGQPVTYSGAGASHAYNGAVSDVARAATQTLTADALARSDCGVEQFLVYAATGSETNRENIGEGYMGILNYGDGTPNATGVALQAAQQRWVAFLASGGFSRGQLALCSGGATPPAALLPLAITVSRTGNGCATGTVTYGGNPLEAASLMLHTPDNRNNSQLVDAFGRNQVCVPRGPAIGYFDIHAEVPKAATSPTWRCMIPGTTCAPLAATAAAPTCTWTTLRPATPRKVKGSARSRTKVKARINCPMVKKGTKLRFVVGLRRRSPLKKTTSKSKTVKKAKEYRVRTVTLKNGKTLTFTAKARIKKGDLLTMLHRVDPKTGVPRVTRSVKLKTPKN